jgi:hypothetical protein
VDQGTKPWHRQVPPMLRALGVEQHTWLDRMRRLSKVQRRSAICDPLRAVQCLVMQPFCCGRLRRGPSVIVPLQVSFIWRIHIVTRNASGE